MPSSSRGVHASTLAGFSPTSTTAACTTASGEALTT